MTVQNMQIQAGDYVEVKQDGTRFQVVSVKTESSGTFAYGPGTIVHVSNLKILARPAK